METFKNRFVKLDANSKLDLTFSQVRDLISQYNEYHLGDKEANKMDDNTLQIVSKYPEKETPEFVNGQNTIRNISGKIVKLELTIDLENGSIVGVGKKS